VGCGDVDADVGAPPGVDSGANTAWYVQHVYVCAAAVSRVPPVLPVGRRRISVATHADTAQLRCSSAGWRVGRGVKTICGWCGCDEWVLWGYVCARVWRCQRCGQRVYVRRRAVRVAVAYTSWSLWLALHRRVAIIVVRRSLPNILYYTG